MCIIRFKKSGNKYVIKKKEPEELLDHCLLLQNKVEFLRYLLKRDNVKDYTKEIVEKGNIFARVTLDLYIIQNNFEIIYSEFEETMKEWVTSKENPYWLGKNRSVTIEDIKEFLEKLLMKLHFLEFEIVEYHLNNYKGGDRQGDVKEYLLELPRMGFHLKYILLVYLNEQLANKR